MPQTKTGPHVLCEPASSQCTWICHETHFIKISHKKMPRPKYAQHVSCEPAQSTRTWTCHKSYFMPRSTNKKLQTKTGTPLFSKRAQWKCTWTKHKNHVMSKLQGQCRTPERAPRSSTGRNSCRKYHHSVWTLCLGNHAVKLLRTQ